MTEDVVIYGELRCHKTRFYAHELDERGVTHRVAEVDRDPQAAAELVELTGSATKFPTLTIKGRKVRNPSLRDLDKELARAGLYDPGLVHDQKSQRFLRHMAPSDAFASYSWQGERMVVGHIEVAPSLRGTGTGSRFATELLDHLVTREHEVRLTCPFLRKTAQQKPEWQSKFALSHE